MKLDDALKEQASSCFYLLFQYKTLNGFKGVLLVTIVLLFNSVLTVQMISAEVPIFLAKACEILIEEITLRSWRSTEMGKRKTLQKSDISHGLAE